MSRNDTMPISLIFQRQSERAICVRDEEDGDDVWLPLSQIEWDDRDLVECGDEITIIAPEWLLENKGLL